MYKYIQVHRYTDIYMWTNQSLLDSGYPTVWGTHLPSQVVFISRLATTQMSDSTDRSIRLWVDMSIYTSLSIYLRLCLYLYLAISTFLYIYVSIHARMLNDYTWQQCSLQRPHPTQRKIGCSPKTKPVHPE